MTVRVVIAEDESIIRLDLAETLAEEGYEVVGQTGRGDEVVDLVRATLPDVAILDVKMPGLDGLSAAQLLSAERLCAVVILTAFSQRELVERAREAGVHAYVLKPFQRNELAPAVEMAWGRFVEMRDLAERTESLGEQLATRKIVDRAKGVLMDRHGLPEHAAFEFVQKTAMRERRTMRSVAEEVIAGTLLPNSAPAAD